MALNATSPNASHLAWIYGGNLPHNASINDTLYDDDQSPLDPPTVLQDPPTNLFSVIGLSLLFFVIVVVGIVGNGLVIGVILVDRKMRSSVTNLFILNLAMADLFIMLLGVPEIVQFQLEQGWLLGVNACRANRFILVVSLYASVLLLMAVCMERFVAIVFPLKAHLFCTRKKIIGVICVIWPVAVGCGTPTLLFNRLVPFRSPDTWLCNIVFPHPKYMLIFKFTEAVVFYYVPMVVQVVLYGMIAKRLYASTAALSTRFQLRPTAHCRSDRANDTVKARKGVVKMLVASVVVYFLSYSPHQIHLLYDAVSPTRMPQSWAFVVFIMIITHVNSAANPILYSIFSQNFRRNFKRCLCCLCYRMRMKEYRRTRFDSFDSRAISRRTSTTSKTTVSRV